MKRTKIWSYAFGVTMVLSLAGCGNSAKKQVNEKMNADSMSVTSNQVGLQEDSALSTLVLDGVKATWIRDNASAKLMPSSLFPDAGEDLMKKLSLENGIPSSISTFLIESNGIQILFDTGMGASDSRLLAGLHALGITPADIKYIYLTHFHGDHIGGLMKNDSVVFPHAEIYASKAEYDSWMKMEAEKNGQVVRAMNAYKDRLHLFAFGDTLPGKVVAMEAVGHTPGHTVFQAGKLLIIGDLIHGAALQLEHPEICATYDMDKQEAIKTRKKLLQYARENGLVIAGMHLPVPAFIK